MESAPTAQGSPHRNGDFHPASTTSQFTIHHSQFTIRCSKPSPIPLTLPLPSHLPPHHRPGMAQAHAHPRLPIARGQPLPLRPDAARQQRGYVGGAIDQGQLEEQPAARAGELSPGQHLRRAGEPPDQPAAGSAQAQCGAGWLGCRHRKESVVSNSSANPTAAASAYRLWPLRFGGGLGRPKISLAASHQR
jgi:hypothetical protein